MDDMAWNGTASNLSASFVCDLTLTNLPYSCLRFVFCIGLEDKKIKENFVLEYLFAFV